MENKIKFGVGLTVIVLLINAVVSYDATRTLIRNDQSVRQTHQVLTELEDTLSTLKDAETGERGYIITGAEDYLGPYKAALSEIDDHIQALKGLTADNPNQRLRIPELELKVADRLASLKAGIELRRAGDIDGVGRLIISGVGKRMMDDLRQFISSMEADENQLLNQRTAESRASQRNTILTFVIANLVACLILLTTATITISGIRARKRGQEELHQQRQLLQITLSSIADGVIACDTRGLVTFLNPMAQNLTGWNSQEAQKQPLSKVFNIVNEQTRLPVESPALRAIREGTIVGLANHTLLVSKHGSEIPIDDSGSPIKTVAGAILGAVVIFRDITSRRRTEDERSRLLTEAENARQAAEAASRTKDEFLAVLSHELRTPLTAVFGWVHVLQGRAVDESTREKALVVIDRNLRIQTRLIDDLLDISRIVRGELQLHREMTNPLEIVKTAIEMIRSSAEAKKLRIRLESDAQPPAISADPARLQQVVWNLLSNAVKFTPKQGEIAVQVGQVHGELQIAVRDTGQGIASDFLPEVFDRFTQADTSSTRSHGGFGLGLALVKQLVELHGGTVMAESFGPGMGSIFTIRLPPSGVISPV